MNPTGEMPTIRTGRNHMRHPCELPSNLGVDSGADLGR
jgi:hypothetical protein